jgi:hypothetical protein
MKTNNARVPDVPESPGRFVTSEVMVAALQNVDAPTGGDRSSFIRNVCQRMRPLATKRPRRNAERRRPSVLLVEDDPCNRELIEDIFRYDGYHDKQVSE